MPDARGLDRAETEGVGPAASGSRGRFGQVVTAGIATAALTAVAAAKPWFEAGLDRSAGVGVRDSDLSIDLPLALALALVALAGWGALLVTRGRWRRLFAVVGAVAAATTLVSAAVAGRTLPDQLRDRLPLGAETATVGATGWYYTALIAGALSVAALVAAVLLVERWPTMSTRYDAPSARAEEATERDLWNALNEGVDPTDRDTP